MDEVKRKFVFNKRGIDFVNLQDVLSLPYIEDRRIDDPEQYRIIGFAKKVLTTFIVEYRVDDLGEYIWVITAWKSTKEERIAYEQETK